jgi:hypothetical protein
MLCMVFASFFLAAAATAAPPSTDPYEIFAQSRRFWEAQQYPGRLEYTVVVRVHEGGQDRVMHYHSGYDGYTGAIVFDPISDEEVAHPHKIPRGFGFTGGKPEAPVDYLGVPELSPNYGFGIGVTPLSVPPRQLTPAELVRQVRDELHDPDPRATPVPSALPSAGLQEIATVYAKNRAYDVSLAGTDDIDGMPAYHLQLAPLREPHRYRLRDLWVDEATYAPRKATLALNFVNGPGTAVPWNVTFAQQDGAVYIGSETALAPMHAFGLVYAQVSVSIEDVRAVEKLPRGLSDFEPVGTAAMLQEPQH